MTKDTSSYNPYNAAMHRIEGEVNARQVHAEARHMPGTSRIPVSLAVWGELSKLKKPGETFDHLLADMIEREKENRFFEDMDRIKKRGNFVAMEW